MKRKLSILLLLTLCSITLFAEIPSRPYPPRLVNDFAGVLAKNEYDQLEESLEKFARETSTQIVVVTIGDLEGNDPGDYAFKLGEKWGVGQKDKDNGLVILLKPKQENSKGEIFIATGYGLEGVLPDAVVNGAIIDKEMIPYFKENNYYKGLTSGIKVIMDISRGEYTASEYQEYYAKESDGIIPALVIIILIFVVFPILRGRRQRFLSPGKSLPFWIAMGMMSGHNSHRGSFGNFSSGRGGFGGFGGGSFGGGGAGGSW
jgi:uncharacterized protein